jgi:type I restriction enzyme S subunit
MIKLGRVASYSASRIDIDKINQNNYVTTDNLLQNKKGKEKASRLPPNTRTLPEYQEQDILVSNIRPYLKKIWFASDYGGASSDILIFKSNPDQCSEYIYYSLLEDRFFSHMMNGSKGSKMPRGDKGQILEFLVFNHTLSTQKKIAKVLSDLDSKIELNNKINLQLEEMAKTIYDYWFVQFDYPDKNGKPYKASSGKMVYSDELKREIPDGWEVKTLSKWIDHNKSGDWGKDSEESNYVKKVSCVRGADLNGLNGKGELNSPTRFILEKNSHKILESHDLIVEISGGSPTQSTGRLAFVTDETLKRFNNPLICSNFCKALTLKDVKYLYNFVYQWNSLYDNNVLFGWEGKTSGIKNLLFDSFTTHQKEPFPKSDIVEKFYEFADPIHNKIQKNLQENQKLTELRDWLLPMLMNGQLSVKETEGGINSSDEQGQSSSTDPRIEYLNK